MMSSRDRKNVNNSIRNLDLTSVRCCSRGSNLEDDICGGQEENWSLLVQQDVTDGLIMTDCRRAIQVLVFKYFVKEFDLDPWMTSQPPNHPDHFSHPTLLHVPLGDWIVLEGLEWIGDFGLRTEMNCDQMYVPCGPHVLQLGTTRLNPASPKPKIIDFPFLSQMNKSNLTCLKLF